MEKVTIVIPNFQGMKYIKECLDSLHPDYQKASVPYLVLVVDNGSTDASRDFVMEYDAYPNYERIMLGSNTGFCHAVNVGIAQTNSEYVILLNNDTKAFPGFVDALYKAIDGQERCFSVSSRMLMWDNPNIVDDAGDLYCVLGWARARGKGHPAPERDHSCRIFSACGGAAIYRRRVFQEMGLFDEAHFAYLEDLDVGYRAQLYGYYNLYEPSAQVLHYGSATTGSRYNERKTYLAAANNVYVLHKNMPWFQRLLNLFPLLLGFGLKYLFFCKKGMGTEYVKGIGKGLAKSYSKTGRKKRQKITAERLPIYGAIQWQLMKNTYYVLRDGQH